MSRLSHHETFPQARRRRPCDYLHPDVAYLRPARSVPSVAASFNRVEVSTWMTQTGVRDILEMVAVVVAAAPPLLAAAFSFSPYITAIAFPLDQKVTYGTSFRNLLQYFLHQHQAMDASILSLSL